MEQISRQLLYQRLRNRVIDLFEMHSTFEDTLGAFEMIDMVDEFLPLDFEQAPNVFSEREKAAISEFMVLANRAADATHENTWDVDWFNGSQEWVWLSGSAKRGLIIFSERGRFSEQEEEDLTS